MRRIGAALVLVFIVGVAYTQDSENELLDNLHYSKAIKTYEKDLKKDPDNNFARHNLAIAYNKTGQSDKSFKLYLDLISKEYQGFNKDDWNNIGQLALAEGLTELADIAFGRLGKSSAQLKPKENAYYKADNFIAINSEYNDFSLVEFKDQFVFTSDRPASVYDLNKNDWTSSPYLTVFKYDTLSKKIKPFEGTLNQVGHNGPVSFSKNNDIATITRASKETRKGINHSKIFIATTTGSKEWNYQKVFDLNQDNSFSCAHGIYLEDLNMMIFSSDMPGGSGEMDLYYIIYGEGNKYSKPVNITSLNTPFNEVFPCKDDNDPNSFYFSSNGYRGFGGLDIYKTTFIDGQWSSPELMPKAINSNYDDFGIVFTDKNKGFVSSNRIGSLGGDDIYSFIKSDKFILEGYLVDEEKNLPLPLQKVYIVDNGNHIIDSVFSNEDGYFSYSKLPYQNLGLMPPSEDGTEMVIRPLDNNTIKDPETNIILLTSKGFIDDSIALDQPKIVTYVIEAFKGKKSRCVVFENGDKAVAISFYVKNDQGKKIDKIKTGTNGCFKLEKLYPEGSYLELSEEFLEMQMRIEDPLENERTNWQDDTRDIKVISNQKCVEYEDGEPAVNVSFAVKDSLGNTVDVLVTNQNGCFNVRKLYDDNSYLELLEESLIELGMKLMPPFDDKTFEWQKSDDRIILRYGKKCMVFKNGGHPSNAKYIIKDEEGNTVEGNYTDEEGCLKVKKLYGEDVYSVYVLDEEGLTYKAKMDTNKHSYLVLEKSDINTDEFEYVTITVKRCVEYEDGSKAVQIKFAVLSESNEKMDQLITDGRGCFTIHKLYDKSKLELDEEELVSMGLRFKNPADIDEYWYFSSEKIVLTFAEKCLTYDNGEKASNARYNIKTSNGEIVESSITDQNGCLKMKKLYTTGGYFIELIDDEGLALKIPIVEEKEPSTIVFNNIYFDFGSYNLSSKSKEVLKDMSIKMKNEPSLKINVHAHTDSRGSDKINKDLSQKRADAVAKYLISQGVQKDRISTFGHGEDKLINSCSDNNECSDEEHAKNRRIEFEFIRN